MTEVTDLLDKGINEVPSADDLGYLDSTVFILRHPQNNMTVFLGDDGGWMKTSTDSMVTDIEDAR